MRRVLVSSAIALFAAGLAILPAAPASATVHEIVGQWCAGQGELEPPGISGGSNGDNFARPLAATGFMTEPQPFTGSAGAGLLITFNYDHPAGKVRGTGVFIVIGQTPAGPLYLELIEPDPSFAAFQHCPRLGG